MRVNMSEHECMFFNCGWSREEWWEKMCGAESFGNLSQWLSAEPPKDFRRRKTGNAWNWRQGHSFGSCCSKLSLASKYLLDNPGQPIQDSDPVILRGSCYFQSQMTFCYPLASVPAVHPLLESLLFTWPSSLKPCLSASHHHFCLLGLCSLRSSA